MVGHDTQANDHPLATAIGPQRNGPLHPHLAEEYKKWSGGRDWKDDFPEWEPVHRILFKNGILGIENVGGDHRQGHRPALHLRVLPVELGARRRLHHPPRRHHRPEGRLPDRERGEVLMHRPQASPRPSRTTRPTTATASRCACSAPKMGGSQDADRRHLALPARRRRRAGRLAAREGLLRAGGRADRDRRRQGDGRARSATAATSARTRAARSSTAATRSARSRSPSRR